MAIRERTSKLRDKSTSLPRPIPKEADDALDIFQRTFPEVTTPEHKLIERWEDLKDIFGSSETATKIVLDEPSVLRARIRQPRWNFNHMCKWLGAQDAAKLALQCPYSLTRRPKKLKRALPALLNLFGSQELVIGLTARIPTLFQIPALDFYSNIHSMIAVCGSPEEAMKVAKPAMDRLRAIDGRPALVPECYPALIAIFGGMKEAHAAIAAQPMLLGRYGNEFMLTLRTLRQLLGKEGAQEALRKAPYLLLPEYAKNVRPVKPLYIVRAFYCLATLFGKEEAQRIAISRPDLLSLGHGFENALTYARGRIGLDAVRSDFDGFLRRTGLDERLVYERAQRPRQGYWTPSQPRRKSVPWSWISTDPEAIVRGQWAEDPSGNITKEVDLEAEEMREEERRFRKYVRERDIDYSVFGAKNEDSSATVFNPDW